MRQPRRTILRAACAALALLGAGLVLARPTTGEARGGAPAAPPGNPNTALGAQIFDDCIRWVARGQSGIAGTTDFHIGVIAELDLDTARHRGPMRLWWKSPDKYRQELTANKRTTTKILNGEFMWIVHPTGKVQRLHGTSEGAAAIRQLKDDRQRMADLAQFITLRSLKGRNVTFTYLGEKQGSGHYAGSWVKITRSAPGVGLMHFWIAYQKDASGRIRGQWPGIVRIDGDPAQRIPTEDFILRSWADSPAGQPRTYRYPRTIEAYSRSPGSPPARFLKATVQDIKINAGLPDSRFRPPLPARR